MLTFKHIGHNNILLFAPTVVMLITNASFSTFQKTDLSLSPVPQQTQLLKSTTIITPVLSSSSRPRSTSREEIYIDDDNLEGSGSRGEVSN